MGLLDTLTGANIGGNFSQGPGQGVGKTSAAFNNMAELQSIESMLSFLGINPTKWLQDYTLSGKAGKQAFNSGNATKVGKTYYDIGSILEQKSTLAGQADKQALSNAQTKYEQLKQQPMLATLSAQAEGKFDSNFSTAVNDMFQQVVSKNLGAGAAQGFLNDPNKQASLTQPAAVAQAKYLQDYQQAAQGTLQGLAGLPQTQAFNPNILAGPQSAQYYLPGVFNAGQMLQQNQQFNANMGFQQQSAQNQAMMSFMKSAAGAAAGGFGAGGAGAAGGMSGAYGGGMSAQQNPFGYAGYGGF